jgi:transcriptional regulator with XRE-family HTH domain
MAGDRVGTAKRGGGAGGSPSAPSRRRGRPSLSKAGPDPIDVHVGARLKARRRQRGMSQTDLADALGLTFQQVQKYERGQNRLSASALWRAAAAVEVPIGFFFDGLRGGAGAVNTTNETAVLHLTQKIRSLDPAVREKISAFVAALIWESR